MYAYMEAPLRACASSHRKRSSHMAPTRAEKPRGSGGREAGRPVREAPTAGQRRSPLPLLATAVAVLLLLSGPRALAYEDEDEHAVALREAWRHSLPCADCLAISAALLEDMRAAYPHGTQVRSEPLSIPVARRRLAWAQRCHSLRARRVGRVARRRR